MDAIKTLGELSSAVTDAKAKADVVDKLKADLASVTAKKQTAIDEAQQAYNDAKVAVDRLQTQFKDIVGELLPATDSRFRVSQ